MSRVTLRRPGSGFRVHRGVVSGALLMTTALALVGCGSDDSTASTTPATSAASATTLSAPNSSGTSASVSASAPAASPEGMPPTGPGEVPQTVPSGFPGPTVVPRSPGDQKYLDQLQAAGVKYSDDGSVAISVATFICQGKADGAADADVRPYVIALAGQEAQLAGVEVDLEKAADVYVKAAEENYCAG